ncbi:MAG: DUF3078 domain-containing protein [Crocinitomicaceae bacterium]
MKKITTILFLFILGTTSAQVTSAEGDLRAKDSDTLRGWDVGGTASLNLSQTALANWNAGGQNSVALNGLVSLYANHRTDKSTWENTLDLGYGVLRQGRPAIWQKTDDKIDLMSKYGRKASGNWYYAGLANFKTQMAPGYNYPNDSVFISKFMAPGYLLGALGMEYNRNSKFTAFIAPITSKTTFVMEPTLSAAGAFGVTPGESVRNEFGGYVRLFYKNDIMENIKLQTKLDLFTNYLDRPQNIDVNWEMLISMKVNKWITVALSTQLIYDHDIKINVDNNGDGVTDEVGPRTQFKEILAVGLAYTF